MSRKASPPVTVHRSHIFAAIGPARPYDRCHRGGGSSAGRPVRARAAARRRGAACRGPLCRQRRRRDRPAGRAAHARLRGREAAEHRRDPHRRRSASTASRGCRTSAAARRPRRDVHEHVRHDLGVLPVARLDPHRAVLASHGVVQNFGPARLHALRPGVEPRGLAALRRLRHGARRQVPERLHLYGHHRDPAGLVGLAARSTRGRRSGTTTTR